jgi:hypothetical protein
VLAASLHRDKQQILPVPQKKALPWLGSSRHSLLSAQRNRAERRKHMNLNQLTILGFIGKNAETKQLPNGSSLTKFSVAMTNRTTSAPSLYRKF